MVSVYLFCTGKNSVNTFFCSSTEEGKSYGVGINKKIIQFFELTF